MHSTLDELLEKIRKEEVVLWAGAGLSMYAGYPSGTELSKLILEELDEDVKCLIDKNQPLPYLTEEILRATEYKRDHLINLVDKAFKKVKSKTNYLHEILRTIPHFSTIITTNYDRLFEEVYQDDCEIVIYDKDIPKLRKDKTHVFKVHGDLNDPNSILITNSDYIKFASDGKSESIYWSVVKERISTNSVLFIGYNLEDQNIEAEFDRIIKTLGKDRLAWYLVSPNLKQSKVNHLRSKNIFYVNDTAENFIKTIHNNIKEHIFEDQKAGLVSSDTFRKFLSSHGLLPTLKSSKESFFLESITGIDDNINGQFRFTLSTESVDFHKLITGETFESLELLGDSISNVDFRLQGLKLLGTNGLKKIRFESIPQVETFIDLIFEDGFELNNISTKIYSNQKRIAFNVKIHDTIIKIELDKPIEQNPNVRLSYSLPERYSRVSDAIELFTLLDKIGKGVRFRVYAREGVMRNFSPDATAIPQLSELAQSYLPYFQSLRKIELNYNERFNDINFFELTESEYSTVQNLTRLIDEGKLIFDWDNELSVSFNPSVNRIEVCSTLDQCESVIASVAMQDQKVMIHGLEISIGYILHEIKEPILLNRAEFISSSSEKLLIKSRAKKVIITYSNSFPEASITIK